MDDNDGKTSGLDEKDLSLYDGKTSGLDEKSQDHLIIYGLVFYVNGSFETPYLEMISLDTDILEKKRIFFKDDKLYEDGELIIEPIQCFEIMKVTDKDAVSKVTNKDAGSKTFNCILYSKKITLSFDEIQYNVKVKDDKLYAMNLSVFRYGKEYIDQVLLKIVHDESSLQTYEEFVKELRETPFFKYNNLSSNTIAFDTYYDEGMINN